LLASSYYQSVIQYSDPVPGLSIPNFPKNPQIFQKIPHFQKNPTFSKKSHIFPKIPNFPKKYQIFQIYPKYRKISKKAKKSQKLNAEVKEL
jgi:hypothetical protein